MARRGRWIHRYYAQLREDLEQHFHKGLGPLPRTLRLLRRRKLRGHYAAVGREIDRWMEDPSALPDLDRLNAFWAGEPMEIPEGRP